VKTLQLFDFQQGGIQALRDGIAAGHRSQMLYGPTGMGKTELAMALLQAAERRGSRAAMVLDRRILVGQTSRRLDAYGIDHGVLMAGHWRYRPHNRIQICSAQTLEKRESFPGLDLMIVDEAHTVRQATADMIKARGDIKVIGLSASPFTDGLGELYSNVVSCATTEELVGMGRLVPLRVFLAKQIDMSGAKKVAGEWSQDEASERGIKIIGDVVSEWAKKTQEIFGGPRKTIVFCAGVEHGAALARQFAEAGYNFVSISYKDDDDFKAEAIKEFSKPDSSIHGLIATDILTKGFDVPDVMIGVSARPFSKSFASHVQQMGRVMRCCEGKQFGLWLDHSGNYLRFREDWEELYCEGVSELADGKEKSKPEPTEKEKQEALCPACGHIFPPRSDTCAHCGYQRVRSNSVIAVAGEMEEIDTVASKADRETKQVWYSGLRWICKERGYKEGWAANKYKEKFGVWPRKLAEAEVPPPPELIRWVKSRNIAWAKSPRR
jgi:DNA repair protein RadD